MNHYGSTTRGGRDRARRLIDRRHTRLHRAALARGRARPSSTSAGSPRQAGGVASVLARRRASVDRKLWLRRRPWLAGTRWVGLHSTQRKIITAAGATFAGNCQPDGRCDHVAVGGSARDVATALVQSVVSKARFRASSAARRRVGENASASLARGVTRYRDPCLGAGQNKNHLTLSMLSKYQPR